MSGNQKSNGGASTATDKVFSPKDLYNLQLLSHLHHEKELTMEQPKPTSLGENLTMEEDAKRAVRDLTKFLSLFTE